MVPLHPADFRLTVFRYDFGEGRGLEPVVDTRVPFGMRHAPEICCRFSRCILRALRRRLQARGVELSTQAGAEVHNVVDDWLTLAVCAAQGGEIWRELQELLRRLGFTINVKPHKLIAPCLRILWLGLQLDSVAQTVSLPPDKVAKAFALLHEMAAIWERRGKRKVTRSQLDKFIGFLTYCAMPVYGGRAFLHRMRRLRYRTDSGAARAPHHHIHLNRAFLLDVQWWLAGR